MNTVLETTKKWVDGNVDDPEYEGFLARVQERFLDNVERGKKQLFTTDSGDLWETYLANIPRDQRQHHNCSCCRHFINRFGSLATIDEEGRINSAIWDANDAPEIYAPAVSAMSRIVARSKVTGVFMSSDPIWGDRKTGIWRHLSVVPQKSMLYKRGVLTANQAMAAKKEDFKTVMYALNEFTQPMIETALTLLKSDSLYRSEKVLGQAQWLYDLHIARASAHGNLRANVVWLAIAKAPAGFCHPRSSMIGTLLEDIAAGMDFTAVSKRFADKMHPLQYQRPQAAPNAGAIAAAEKLVEQMGIARSLPRRFARLEDVKALWLPAPMVAKTQAGVFDHLKPKEHAGVDMKIPPQTMTWDKFQRTVLPMADKVEIYVGLHQNSHFTSLVTAVNYDAPPIIQWDTEEARNPVSWYLWHGGSTPHQFGLKGGVFHPVSAVALKPSMWNGGNEHQGKGVVFLIEGAKDSRVAGCCLFPEVLKSELHGVRSVIEAFSRSTDLQGMDEASAAGLMYGEGKEWDALLRVTTAGKSMEYKLDRWD